MLGAPALNLGGLLLHSNMSVCVLFWGAENNMTPDTVLRKWNARIPQPAGNAPIDVTWNAVSFYC